jgi:polyisoprenoid-binding protein YceI
MFRRLLTLTTMAAAVALTPPVLAAEAYVFDAAHSNVQFSWNHFGFSTTSAEFEDFSGQLMYNADEPTQSAIDVEIDMASVDSGVDTFNGHLRNKPEWFDVDKHPTAHFDSTNIEAVGDNRYHVTGDLTLKGVTREVTLDTMINKIGKHPTTKARTIGLDATTTVSRSQFDMGKYAPAVSDDVTIDISAEMQRKADLDEEQG